MDRAPTREEAARVLGVSAAAPPDEVKRAYRRQVRTHHPDAGGDPATFQQLQQAFERLTDAAAPATPVVSRGRPSRPPVPFVDEAEQADLGRVDWSVPLPTDGAPLSVDTVAVWLTADPDVPLGVVRATSRAPSSRLNRVARHLASELTSTLVVGPRLDDRGRQHVGIEVTGASRRARHSLEAVGIEDGWVRTRGSTTTSLRTLLRPSSDPRSTAVRAATRLDALLEDIGWPLSSWRAEVAGDRAPITGT